ncbi:uncharacterized protein LOC124168146 [Ischnura elegans]|uniref:uncharacterized protein LOC124168146 n=1 Tax=Ischnura elegans TaxID=197161 RepID=UPI001ED8986C|nr:uncharacterized protein LOC124168146 [Ischnura elegans]
MSYVSLTLQRNLAFKPRVGWRLLSVALLTLATSSAAAPHSGLGLPPVDLTAGAYLKPLPNITVYTTSTPLVFKLPYNPASQLRLLREMVGRTCNSADRRPVCGLPRMAVDDALRNWDRRNWLESLTEAPLATDGGAMTSAFSLPTRRLSKRMLISDAEGEELEDKLAEAGTVTNLSAPCVANYAPAHGTEPDYGLLTVVLSTIAAQMDVLSMCQTRRLSPSVVNVERLRTELLSVQKSIHNRGWELAIKHFSRYYILSLVDCLLSPTSLYLFLVIPLTKANTTSVSLHSFVPIPFAYGDHTCQITAPATELALIRTAEGVQLGELQCNPYRDELCSLEAARDDDSIPMRCARRVAVGGSADEAARECPLRCRKSAETRVLSLGPSTFLITHPPKDAAILCDGVRWSNWGAENKGSFHISLPCGCRLVFDGSEVNPSFPCIPSTAPSLSIRRLIPAEWSLLLSITLPPFSLAHSSTCTDLNECTKSSWNPERNSPLELRPWMLFLNMAVIAFLSIPALVLSIRPYIDCFHTPTPFFLREDNHSPALRPPTPPPVSPARRGPPAFPPPAIPSAAASFRRPTPILSAEAPVYEVIEETTYLPMRRPPPVR